MYLATVTNQFQITLPAKLRRQHGIKAGHKLLISGTDPGTLILQPLLEPQATFGLLKSADQNQAPNPHSVWTSRYAKT